MTQNEQPELEITEFDKLELFVTKHAKSILLSVVGVILLVAAGVIIADQMEQANKRSVAAITGAESTEELVSVIAAESGNKTVVTAQIRLAKQYVEDKDYAKAEEVYAAILASGAAETIKTRVKLNSAALIEVQGKTDEAIAAYKAISAVPDLSAEARAEADYASARLLNAQGKKADAEAILKELAAGNTAWGQQADQMLKRL